MKQMHECELKLKITTEDMYINIKNMLNHLGYVSNVSRIETDYILDNSIHSLSKKKILFRIRKINNKKEKKILFTLKIKGNANNFQEHMEIETFSSLGNETGATKIINIIESQIGVKVPIDVFKMNQISDILPRLEVVGITPYNIVQKKRQEFVDSKSNVSFDTFPDPVGMFIEIEAGSEKDLFNTVKRLQLQDESFEKRNYGKIIAEATGGATKCVFE